MCVPACTKKIATDLNRRGFLKGAGMAAATLAAAGCVAPLESGAMPSQTVPPVATGPAFSGVVDMTHTLSTDFPTFDGVVQLEIERVFSLASDGYNLSRWLLNEHTGTHMDAPFHFSDGLTADQIPIQDLIGPLANVDIRAKAEENPDAQLTPDDLLAWEADHGEIPAGAIVAMNSGWDAHVASATFRNADDGGVMHFPGFHIEAIEFLLGERNVKGIMVDTLSLDYGPSPDFAVHYRWLPANKWGMECVANLGTLPATGATVIAAGPTVAGATGGPSRVLALL